MPPCTYVTVTPTAIDTADMGQSGHNTLSETFYQDRPALRDWRRRTRRWYPDGRVWWLLTGIPRSQSSQPLPSRVFLHFACRLISTTHDQLNVQSDLKCLSCPCRVNEPMNNRLVEWTALAVRLLFSPPLTGILRELQLQFGPGRL